MKRFAPDVRLTVPPLPPKAHLGSALLRAEFKRLQAMLAARVRNGIGTFGLEQKAVAYCSIKGINHSTLDDRIGRGAQTPGDPRRLITARLSFEPLVFSYWRLFTEDGLTSKNVLDLALVLGGPKGVTRTTPIGAGTEATGYTRYPPPPDLDWPKRVLEHARSNADPLSSALIALGMVLMIHPLEDGNGRLARAMLWSRLALIGDTLGPLAPLGFTMCLNPAWTVAFSADLGVRGDWQAFADRYIELLNYSMTLSIEMCEQGLIGEAAAAR